MGWVLVIEENQGLLDEIKDAVSQIDPKAELVHFPNSRAFLAWMDQLQAQDPQISPPKPADRFLGIVTAIETWRFKDIRLIGKFKALFIQQGLAATEDEIFVVFTAYEAPDFQKKRFEYRSVNNVIFKPFDKLVLLQVLDIAMKGRTALKNQFAHTAKSGAEIEMLKEVLLTGIGELGFQTQAAEPLKIGAVAKYYANFLATRQHRSALAQVLSFEKTEGKEMGTAELRFFAVDQTQSFNIQKLAQKGNSKRTLPNAREIAEFEFIFVKRDGSGLCDEVRPSIERFYDHPIRVFESLSDLTKYLLEKPLPVEKRFVFIDHGHIAGDEVKEVESIMTMHADKNLAICLLCPRILTEPMELELSALCEDIFYSPFNRSYIVKGLKRKFSALRNKEELFESHHETEQQIHVSNPVQLVEISEAGLIMAYHREVQLGSFREFHLTLPNENEVVPLMAQCNFTEQTQDKKIFHCHFAFFGLRDHELKFVRRWMLNQYVGEKQKSSQ